MDKKDFLKARKKTIRASDIPAILGICPFRTAYSVWLDKTSRKIELTSSYAADVGNKMEPIARAKYELLAGKSYAPLMVTNSEYSFLGCSLDGCAEDQQSLIEIKWVGTNFLTDIKKEKPNYWAQVQFQMLVTGITDAHLVEINDKEEIKATKIEVDLEYCKMLFKVASDFWDLVKTKTPPKLTAKDVLPLKEKDKLAALNKMKKLDAKIKRLTEQYEALKDGVLKDLNGHGYGFKCGAITYVEKVGGIDYKAIKELQGVDLEQYRKRPSKFFTIKFKDAKK
jgi:putative phage-type endonuclease